MEKPTKERLEKWRKDPANWKGSFYFNKEDKRLFVPKQAKILGWTMNLANPYSIMAVLGLALLIILLASIF